VIGKQQQQQQPNFRQTNDCSDHQGSDYYDYLFTAITFGSIVEISSLFFVDCAGLETVVFSLGLVDTQPVLVAECRIRKHFRGPPSDST
jgi:hypothetical protein